jgi:hypothetical protein
LIKGIRIHMKNKFKWGGLLALVGFLSLASGTASAAIINFSFTNLGSVDSITSCGSGCKSLQTSGDLIVGGSVVGTFAGTMKLLQTDWLEYDVTPASTWSFLDTSGTNNLFGTLSGDLLGILKLAGGGSLSYGIGGGSGFFAGASGGGASTFAFLGNGYAETGWLSVLVPDPASVPEPGVTSLLLAGLGMMGVLAYRRRRAQAKI